MAAGFELLLVLPMAVGSELPLVLAY